jgi:uncharacterized membrane protein
MMSKGQWLWRQLTRRLWFRATLLSVLAVATALFAVAAAPYIPPDLSAKIGADAVDNILNILASSLLAVTIFSLSTAVSAYENAAQRVSPRATQLLIEDETAQNALATFIGAFLFSLVSLVALSTGAYGEEGRVVLFAATVFVIALIVLTLLRWIDHLSRLGTVAETTSRVETAATRAIRDRRKNPHLGGQSLEDSEDHVPADARPIAPAKTGYVQHVDIQALQDLAERHDGQVLVAALPGTFVDPSRPLAHVERIDADEDAAVRSAFTVDRERTFDQDPRFGLCVLAEIASRALSPSINDPGTAIDVIGRGVRVLSAWSDRDDDQEAPRCSRVRVPGIRRGDLFDDFFRPIARDGAAFFEVQMRLQKALRALAAVDACNAKHAARSAATALARAEAKLAFDDELAPLRELAAELARQASKT